MNNEKKSKANSTEINYRAINTQVFKMMLQTLNIKQHELSYRMGYSPSYIATKLHYNELNLGIIFTMRRYINDYYDPDAFMKVYKKCIKYNRQYNRLQKRREQAAILEKEVKKLQDTIENALKHRADIALGTLKNSGIL